MIGVYCIENTTNNHKYVGSSNNIDKRFLQHKSALFQNKHHSRYLQRAWNKYGEGTFRFYVLCLCEESECQFQEQAYMDNLHPEYNMSKYADSTMRGRKHSKKTRSKIKKILSELFTPEQLLDRAKHASKYALLPEARQKHKESVQKSFTTERLSKMRTFQKEIWNNPKYREQQIESHRNYSDEVKSKFSDAQKKLWEDPEYKERASKARRGKGSATHTPEQVIEIRRLHFQDKLTARRISEIYKEPYRTIRAILYQNWKWLDE